MMGMYIEVMQTANRHLADLADRGSLTHGQLQICVASEVSGSPQIWSEHGWPSTGGKEWSDFGCDFLHALFFLPHRQNF
eukprot:scaffold18276_cov114-Skeletonema_dohrnii-CCMP3373.AAC.1